MSSEDTTNKMIGTTLLYLIPAPVIHLVEKYLFADWQFLVFLAILIMLDTTLGFAQAWREKRVDSEDFAALFKKVIVYMVLLILTHVMVHFTVAGAPNPIFGWLSSTIYSALMVRESLSILKNLGRIHPGLVSQALLKRLKSFDTTNGTPLQ